ncbi:MAG TPA: biotin/lipoyl-binding protein, partial [Gemmatimonadales bacterium]|nr:biotin/lipoyl-binding protein [Gemmatimonadales bacterium]
MRNEHMAATYEPETDAPARPAGRPAAPARPKRSRRTVFMILGVVVLGLLIFGARKWWFARSHVTTDNAQVDGHIIPVLPKVGGYVTEVRAEENLAVQAGDTLVVLDDRDFRARLAQTEADLAALLATISRGSRVGQAEALVAQAEANARRAQADLARIEPLATQNVVSQQQLDAARAAAAAATAQLAAAQAALVGADARV